jgi:hypothetical protein
MSHHPPTYSHSTDPLDADDWLKTVTKKLERALSVMTEKWSFMLLGAWKGRHRIGGMLTQSLTLRPMPLHGSSSEMLFAHTTSLMGY